MGTNYYTRDNECKHCGRYEEIHLGKSSGGWQFIFQYNGGKFYKNVNEMKEWLKERQIWDEYGEKVSHKDFWDMVKEKKKIKHAQKYGEKGSNDFLIDGYSFSDCCFI